MRATRPAVPRSSRPFFFDTPDNPKHAKFVINAQEKKNKERKKEGVGVAWSCVDVGASEALCCEVPHPRALHCQLIWPATDSARRAPREREEHKHSTTLQLHGYREMF